MASTKTVAVVTNETVSNIHIANAAYTLQSNEVDVTSITPQPMIGWSYANNAFSAPVIVYALPKLASQLIAAASAASDSITAQIARTQTHLAGYQSAANMVRAANGAPTSGSDGTAFGALVTATGIAAATLAPLVQGMDGASVQNLAILVTLETAAAAATTAAQLATALSAFETNLSAFVATLNKMGLTTTIVAPPTISISGIDG